MVYELDEIDEEILLAIYNSNNFISGDTLSNICNVSINTLRKKIDLLNLYLKPHGIKIIAKTAVGYIISYDNQESYIYMESMIKEMFRFKYINYPRYSTVFKIIFELLNTNEYVSIDHFMNEFYCSKSTLLRTLADAPIILNKFKLELKNKRNFGIYIEGNEWGKRLCLTYIHKVYVHNKTLLPQNKNIFPLEHFNNKVYIENIRENILSFAILYVL